MASLLAEIDWDNLSDLDSAEMTTAVKLLLQATQERYNIGRLNIDGDYFDNPGDPHVYTFPSVDPTTPTFELNSGDPLIDFTSQVQNLLQDCLRFYVDTDKVDSYIGDTVAGAPVIKTYAAAADDSGTYDNQLFEKLGYESWPDLRLYCAAEVKKWYDMIIALKVVWRVYINVTGGPVNDNYRIYTGEFDKYFTKTFVVDEDGADYYGGATKGDGGEATTNTTPYTDFKAGNDNLFDSGSSTFEEGTDTEEEPTWYIPYKLEVGRLVGGNYWNWIKSFRFTVAVDWTDVETNLGIQGRPHNYDASIDKIHTFNEDFPTGLDPNTGTPAAEDVIYRRSIESVTTVGDVVKIEIDDQITPGAMPTNITDIGTNEEISIHVELHNSARGVFYEDWYGDGMTDGGFLYY